MQNDKTLFTVTEVARLARLTPDYVRQLILAGKIKAEKVGSVWIVTKNEVIRFLSMREK